MATEAKNVVFFDGHCVLCNGTVERLIKIDRKRKLRYSSLQGEFATKKLSELQRQTLSSVVYWSDGAFYERAEAAAHILIDIGGTYSVLGRILGFVPLFISNVVYDWVARNRYAMFGRNEECMIPSPEQRELFIP